jgi:beta-N-acetylhexosaminidase
VDLPPPVLLVAVRNPCDIADLSRVQTCLATYSWTRPSMGAVGRVLLGKVDPAGKLPVRIPAADDPNVTLYPYGFGLDF